MPGRDIPTVMKAMDMLRHPERYPNEPTKKDTRDPDDTDGLRLIDGDTIPSNKQNLKRSKSELFM